MVYDKVKIVLLPSKAQTSKEKSPNLLARKGFIGGVLESVEKPSEVNGLTDKHAIKFPKDKIFWERRQQSFKK
jgi:hypothetical protein